jgi:hypothetical protein
MCDGEHGSTATTNCPAPLNRAARHREVLLDTQSSKTNGRGSGDISDDTGTGVVIANGDILSTDIECRERTPDTRA